MQRAKTHNDEKLQGYDSNPHNGDEKHFKTFSQLGNEKKCEHLDYNKDVTFTPDINHNSKKIVESQRPENYRVDNTLYQDAKDRQERLHAKIVHKKEYEKNLRNTSFMNNKSVGIIIDKLI